MPVTVPDLLARKRRGEPLVMLTAYDASQARLASAAGIDLLLVGDSLGMVVQGHRDTVAVTVDCVAYHTAAVSRGTEGPLLIADMPFLSYPDPASAIATARALMQAGAAMVKLEGGGWTEPIIRELSARDVPVCAHLGLTPQSIHKLGGFKVQGRDHAAAMALIEEALRLQDCGASLLVLECVPAELASEVTRRLDIPTIGIGAGPGTDGQVLVFYDAIGATPLPRPRFVQDFLAGRGSLHEALVAYREAVKGGSFPGPEHAY